MFYSARAALDVLRETGAGAPAAGGRSGKVLGPGGVGVRPPVAHVARAAHTEVGDRFARQANIRVRRSTNHVKRFPIKSGWLMRLCRLRVFA